MTLRTLQKSVALLACLALLSFASAQARVESATVVVEGMSCPFCAFGVEKRLKKVEGVGSIEVNMDTGSASMSASEGESIDFSSLPEAIRKAGFTPGPVDITAVGTLSAGNEERSLFKVSGTDQEMLLVNLSEEIKKKIAEFSAAGMRMRVKGTLHFHTDEVPALEPNSVEAIEP